MPMYWSLKNSELGKKENEKLLTIFNESLSNAPFSISLNWIITNWLYSKKVGCYSDRSCFKEPATLEEKDLPELENI